MASAPFDFAPLLRPNLPPAAVKWGGFPKYNFVGGHNDAESVPVEAFIAAATAALKREGSTLATYNLESGPLGYRPLREFLSAKLKRHAGIDASPDEILITSGSLQGLDLVNGALLQSGDTVIIEQGTYGGSLTRAARLGVNVVGATLDQGGIVIAALDEKLAALQAKGIKPKYIYTIPTVQNPTGSVMKEDRRRALLALAEKYDVPIFEDECYSDLVWTNTRPQALYGMDKGNRTIHVGSFSKSLAPALRTGYVVARWEVLSRLLPLKTDGGTPAIEQMVLAEYCPKHFDDHVVKLNRKLKGKLDALMEAVNAEFGTAAEFDEPEGGIFLWVTLPENVDTGALALEAAKQGVAINPGPEWATDKDWARRRLRLCFANPSVETIREGVAKLAEVCHRMYGIPEHGANMPRG